MPSIEVRPFRRSDREQLTHLVNVHAAAVIPGMSASVNTVMSQLEREPGEFIADPWVIERTTLVAEQRRRVVAAAHLLRYAADASVSESYRDSAEIRWFVFWPEAPFWPDSTEAANALIAACIAQLDRWGVSDQGADGALPVPGVYGVPEQWPHIRAAYERADFVHQGRTEIVYMANVDDIPRPPQVPIDDLRLRRSVGINGTRSTGLATHIDPNVASGLRARTTTSPTIISRSETCCYVHSDVVVGVGVARISGIPFEISRQRSNGSKSALRRSWWSTALSFAVPS